MKQLTISFMIFVFPHLLLSQTLNWENDKIEAHPTNPVEGCADANPKLLLNDT